MIRWGIVVSALPSSLSSSSSSSSSSSRPPRRPRLHHCHRFVPLAPQTKLAGRTDFAEFVSPAPVDVAKPDVAAPSRLVAFSSPHHMRGIQWPGTPRTEAYL